MHFNLNTLINQIRKTLHAHILLTSISMRIAVITVVIKNNLFNYLCKTWPFMYNIMLKRGLKERHTKSIN